MLLLRTAKWKGLQTSIYIYKNKQSELGLPPIEEQTRRVYSNLTSSITAFKEVYEFLPSLQHQERVLEGSLNSLLLRKQ